MADEAQPHEALILVLGYCGLRWGEASALRVRDADLLRGRLQVRRSIAEVNGRLIYGTTKTHATRTVPVPARLCALLPQHMAGKGPDGLLFTAPKGGPLRVGGFRRQVFDRAVGAAGMDGLTPHDLRHTAASLAVSARAT